MNLANEKSLLGEKKATLTMYVTIGRTLFIKYKFRAAFLLLC